MRKIFISRLKSTRFIRFGVIAVSLALLALGTYATTAFAAEKNTTRARQNQLPTTLAEAQIGFSSSNGVSLNVANNALKAQFSAANLQSGNKYTAVIFANSCNNDPGNVADKVSFKASSGNSSSGSTNFGTTSGKSGKTITVTFKNTQSIPSGDSFAITSGSTQNIVDCADINNPNNDTSLTISFNNNSTQSTGMNTAQQGQVTGVVVLEQSTPQGTNQSDKLNILTDIQGQNIQPGSSYTLLVDYQNNKVCNLPITSDNQNAFINAAVSCTPSTTNGALTGSFDNQWSVQLQDNTGNIIANAPVAAFPWNGNNNTNNSSGF